MAVNVSLMSAPNRVEVPFIKVQIGTYVFGVYHKTAVKMYDEQGFFKAQKIVYPNYVKSLTVRKINGQVNTYTLVLQYPITQNDDPNFFEKVFSSVSKTRKIVFSYGDMALPSYIYRDEQAIITSVKSSFNIQNAFNSVIQYTVQAVSSAALGTSGTYNFITQGKRKPSDEIKKILYNPTYGLQELFYGMNDRAAVEAAGLIPGDDREVELEAKLNISALDYISYLVSCMIPADGPYSNKLKDIYLLVIRDDTSYDDLGTRETLGGPYFKIIRNNHTVDHSDAYELDIGYPSNNIVIAFNVQNDENYSIYYNWNKEISTEYYVRRLDDEGRWEDVYAPTISSRNSLHKNRPNDSTYWTKVTEYPIKATVTLKGLLRPAILMTYVRLNVIFPGGKKHITSGLYIVTEQTDSISENGYTTTLSLVRVGSDLGETNYGI